MNLQSDGQFIFPTKAFWSASVDLPFNGSTDHGPITNRPVLGLFDHHLLIESAINHTGPIGALVPVGPYKAE